MTNKDNMKHRRLQELSQSDFEIVKGEPDIRGWKVKTGNGETIGRVEELILDARGKKVRYCLLDLDKKIRTDKEKVLVPIGLAEVHEKEDEVWLPSVQLNQLQQLPAYDRDALDAKTEWAICSTLGRTKDATAATAEQRLLPPAKRQDNLEGLEPEPDFYRHDHFNDDNLYRHRLREPRAEEEQLSDYEKGLRLWEKRSQGGVIPDAASSGRGRSPVKRKISEAAPQEVQHHRDSRRRDTGGQAPARHPRRGHTIEDRIRREGLRDPD